MSFSSTFSKRVLVISSAPFSTQKNNGKTLSSFFEGCDINQVAQFCFSGGDCNPSICNRYFFLTNDDVIKRRSGKSYSADEISSSVSSMKNRKGIFRRLFHFLSQARTPIAIFIKNLIWSQAHYSDAIEWIQAFNPSIVFFQGFSMAYGYKFALKICDTLNVPFILELTDDYTHQLYPFSLLGKFNHHQYMRLFKEALLRAKKTFVISEMMKEEYQSLYGGKMDVLFNCANTTQGNGQILRTAGDYVYAGNLLLNRWKVLISLGRALSIVDKDAILSIYTPDTPPKHILRSLSQIPSIKYCGTLSKKNLERRLDTCEYVVHVEAFDKKNRKITRLSLSTKISEYLASGAKILAIGPPEVASIKTLAENNLACCITRPSTESIIKSLRTHQFPDDHFAKSLNFLQQYTATNKLNFAQYVSSICDNP